VSDRVKNRYRVGIITIVETEAHDWTDAANVAEGVVRHALRQSDSGDSNARHVVVKFRQRGFDYEGTIVRSPVELNRGAHTGYFGLTVEQPAESEEDSDG
jgi:hypothetical protein